MTNLAWASLLVVLLAALSVYSWIWQRPVAVVVLCHNIVWAGAISLVGSNLIAYKEASPIAWLTLATGIVAFNAGAWLSRWLSRAISARWSSDRSITEVSNLLSRKTLLALLFLYVAAFAYYLAVISSRFGLDKILTASSAIRGAKGESYLESIPLPIRLLLYLGPLLFVVFGFRKSMSNPLPVGVRGAGLALVTISMLALLQRTNLFMGILGLLAIIITSRAHIPAESNGADAAARTKRPRRLLRRFRVPIAALVLLVVALGAFQGLGLLLGKNGDNGLDNSAISPPLASSGLSQPFAYYTGGTAAFLQLVDSQNYSWPKPYEPGAPIVLGDNNPQTWGASFFSPVLKAIPGGRPYGEINPFINTGVLTNVFTWLEPFYRDFRIFGVGIGMILVGATIGFCFVLRFRSTRLFWIQSALVSTVFLATFVSKVNNTQLLAELIVLFLLTIKWRRLLPKKLLGISDPLGLPTAALAADKEKEKGFE